MQNEAILCAFLAPIRNNPPGRARDPENKKRRLVNCLSRTVTPFLPDYDSLRIEPTEWCSGSWWAQTTAAPLEHQAIAVFRSKQAFIDQGISTAISKYALVHADQKVIGKSC